MQYKLSFQYKSKDSDRPRDEQLQDEEIILSEPLWIPNVGDSISCSCEDERKAFKVLTRHFSYSTENIIVNIVVTDIDSEEMSSRINE
jgi:hypothetical protein